MPPLTALPAFLKLPTLILLFASLLACSDSSDNNPPAEAGDPDFPGYTVVSLEPGDDLEGRALEALITAEPNTIVQLPAGTYDFVRRIIVP